MPFQGFIRGYLFFIRFVSRPYRDAGLLVVLSRHCEDSVLLYRVMQGLVPIGTGHVANITASRASRQGRDMHNTVQAPQGAVP